MKWFTIRKYSVYFKTVLTKTMNALLGVHQLNGDVTLSLCQVTCSISSQMYNYCCSHHGVRKVGLNEKIENICITYGAYFLYTGFCYLRVLHSFAHRKDVMINHKHCTEGSLNPEGRLKQCLWSYDTVVYTNIKPSEELIIAFSFHSFQKTVFCLDHKQA